MLVLFKGMIDVTSATKISTYHISSELKAMKQGLTGQLVENVACDKAMSHSAMEL